MEGKNPTFFKSQRDGLTAEVLDKSMKTRTKDSVLRAVKNYTNLQI